MTQISNVNTSVILLKDNYKRSKSLIEEAYLHIQEMKIGESFKKIINEKGRTIQTLLFLSPDESSLIIINKKCCMSDEVICLEKISSCEVGYLNSYYTKKKFNNYFSIVLNTNKYYEFYHQTEGISKKWVNSINYLLQNKNRNLESIDKIKLEKNEISNIWQTEIIPNWTTYRKYLHDKNKENYFTKKLKSNKKRMCRKKDIKENIEILKENNEEILYLWTLGLPPWLRKYLWNIVIWNELEITENLFQGYEKEIKKEILKTSNITNRISKSTYNTSLISGEDLKNNLLKDIKNDIQSYYNKNINIINNENKPNFKEEVLIIVRSFCLFRLDILYTKEITELAAFIYLNSDNYYIAFRILCNLIIPSYLFDFLQNDFEKFKNYCEFFDLLMQKYVPFLYNYFQSINFSTMNMFYKWTKNLFLRAFNYNICLIIFDNFIIKGKIFVFQVALAILIIKQKEIINCDLNSLFLLLIKSQFNIDEKVLFSEIEKLDIRDEYKEFFDIYSLGKEKIELFQDL